MAQNDRKRGGTFVAKWIVAEKVKAGLRHAAVCPNVTGRTKERIFVFLGFEAIAAFRSVAQSLL